jgi:hypothetical protein
VFSVTRNFVICTGLHRLSVGLEGMHAEYWWGNLLENVYSNDRRSGRSDIKIDLMEISLIRKKSDTTQNYHFSAEAI